MNNRIDERRANFRLSYNTVVLCSKCILDGRIETYDPPLEMQVVNISMDGLCISTSKVFMEGAVLEFDMALEEIIYKNTFARIMWLIKSDRTYRYGLNIKNMTGRLSTHICKLENRISESV